MKVLAVYDTRHGFTEHCLNFLAAELSFVEFWPLTTRPGVPDWDTYDVVIFGGPVYWGRWSRRLTGFLSRHLGALQARPRVGAFITCLSPRADALRYFSAGLPAGLKGHLGKVAFFGGGLTWSQLSWWERGILKWHKGLETDVSNLDLTEIQALAGWIAEKPGAS